jgi:polysaccharide pyruvyl transferase WcaK-like protein
MKAVLIGNYGVGNFGDEALKGYFLGAFPEVEWLVPSARPGVGEYPRLPVGFRSLFRTPWWKTLGAIRRADALVFGGGTLFTDIESVKACWLWGVHAFAARCFGVPTYLAFQGVGPFHTRVGEGIARYVVRSARYVSVRDASSLARVRPWRPDAVATFDPVFLLFLQRKKERRPDGGALLIPRHNSGEAFLRACDAVPADASVTVALFQPKDAGEVWMSELLKTRFPRSTVRVIEDVDALMGALAHAESCVCERFHGALAAAAAGVPTTLVSRASGDKLDEARSLFAAPAVDASKAAAEAGESSLRTALQD